MKASDVGWQPLSAIRFSLWPSTPAGNWRFTARFSAPSQCQARAWHWLVALNRAVNRQFPHGIEGQRLNLMADNGCQPTSLAFMRACAALGIRQAFTSYSNPKGNADTERFLRTLKEELVWLHEWTSPAAFFEALDRWLAGYNASYLHSALGYRAPNAVEAEHLGHATPLAAAC